MKLESKFQTELKKDLHSMFPGCLITKLDPNDIPGIPDLLILHGPRWAILECKRYEKATHQPNQDYYVGMLNEMSYSAFIYPENKEEILDELQSALQPRRKARVSKRK